MSDPPIILRDTWGARWGRGWSLRNLPATSIWLHHPVVRNLPANATFEQECADMRLIEDIGRQRFRSADFKDGKERWPLPLGSGISYSYGVYRSARIYQGHELRRFSSHTAGYNDTGIGIFVQGNTDLEDMTPQQVESVARLLVRLKRDGVATTARLTGGHRDTGFATSCPGSHAYARIAQINARAAEIEQAEQTPPVPAPPAPPRQPDPHAQRAQAALNWLLQPTIPLAEDGWLGTLTNGADNEWRALDPTTPPMTPTDVYADHMEATVTAIDSLRQLIIDRTTVTLNDRAAALTGNAPGRRLSLSQAVNLCLILAANSWVHARQAEAHAAAGEAALESLAGQTAGIDVEAVKKAAQAGASEALGRVEFNVSAASVVAIEDEED